MKYLILLVLFALASCSLSNPLDNGSQQETVSGSFIEDVQESNSWTVTSSGMEDTEDKNNSGSTSEEVSGIGEKWEKETKDISKDPEVQKIQQDIDALFKDLEKGGK